MIAFLDGPELVVLFTILVLLPLYFLPTFLAVRRKSSQIAAVVLIDILLGWTVIGWIVALILALTSRTTMPPMPAPLASTPAGWYSDPQGLARMRYFDGSRWTEHTSQ